jgi:hypothetical protein
MALDDSSSPSSVTADTGVLPAGGLPMGATYRLDAEFFEAEDLDGVGESALGSGNLNHLILQSQLINGFADPTAGGADRLVGELPLAADLGARGAGSSATTAEPTFDGRLLDPAPGDAPPADGTTSDQRGFGQPTELFTLIGGSHAAGAGAGGFTARFAGAAGPAADVSVTGLAPPAVEPDTTPAGPPPGDLPAEPGGGPDGTVAGVLDDALGGIDDLAATVADLVTPVADGVAPVVDPVVDVIGQAVDALPSGAGDTVGDVTDAGGEVAQAALDAADQVVDTLSTTGDDLVAGVNAATDAALATAAGTVTDAIPLPGVADRLTGTFQDAGASLVADAGETATAIQGSAAPPVETVDSVLNGFTGSTAETSAAVSGSLQETVAPVVDGAQQTAAPLLDAVRGAADDAAGQATGAVDDGAAAVADAAAPVLDDAADLGATVGDAVDGASDDTASLLDDAGQAADTAGSDLGGLTDSLLADDTGSSGDQDLGIAAEGGVDGDQQAGTASEVNLDALENVTGDIDVAVDGSADAPAGADGSVDASIDDLSAAADSQDLNDSLETVDSQPLDDALGDIQSDLAAMDGAASDQGDLLTAAGDDSALDGSMPDDVIGDLVPDTSTLGTDSFDDLASGGGEVLPEPDGVAAEGLGMLLDPQIDQSPGAGLFG